MSERLVVIGADAAGMSAASQARKRRGPEDLEIVAFERGNYTSYSACGIPYFVGNVVEDFDDLVVRGPDEFRDRQQIDVSIRHEVVGIDTKAGRITVRDLDEGNERDEPYDQLMVATGGEPIRPALEGIETEGIFGVQTLDDGLAIERFIERESPKHAVVIGGGYIGLEMAEAM